MPYDELEIISILNVVYLIGNRIDNVMFIVRKHIINYFYSIKKVNPINGEVTVY